MKARTTYLAWFFLLTMFIFIAAKVVFMMVNHDAADFSAADVADVIAHGLTLDGSTALYFLIIPFLAMAVSVFLPLPRWVLRAYYVLLAVAFALAFVADSSMYAFWNFKLDASWLQYLSTPAEAMASVSMGYLAVRLAALVVVAALIYRLYALIPLPTGRGRRAEVLLYVALSPLMVVGIRGGVAESTTNTGQVYFSPVQFLNHAAVNPLFNFFYSLGHQLDDLDQYQFFSPDECARYLEGIYTTESQHADTLLTTDRPDVLIILLESAGEEFAGVMPRLQQLKHEGIWFSRCYANSWRTDRGTVAVLSGWPTFPTLSVMKIPEKSRTLPAIAKSLKQVGYATSYLYGGDINFTNMRSYLVGSGWDRLTSMSDYSLEEQHTAQWGVRDDITFGTLYEQMTRSPRSGDHGPRLWGYSTLSSHEPWDVPLERHADEVLNAFAYLDDCLYDFILRLRQTDVWQNLLVVLIADHGIIYRHIDNQHPLQKNHIPMLWLGGAVREPREIATLCNQSDLAATLLGQLHLPHTDYTFSRDVLSATYTTPTAVSNYSNVQWICDSTGHVLYDFDLQRPTISESSDTARLLRTNKAILQATVDDLKNRK